MRVLLIIGLIAALNCSVVRGVETIFCIVTNKNLVDFVIKATALFESKKYKGIPDLVLANLSTLYNAVTLCLDNEDNLLLRSKLEKITPPPMSK